MLEWLYHYSLEVRLVIGIIIKLLFLAEPYLFEKETSARG